MKNQVQTDIILPDSPGTATPHTLDGFLAKDGSFYRKDAESTCRWHSATHVYCLECNKPCPKSQTKCADCINKENLAKWLQKPVVEWDHTGGLYSEFYDHFYFSAGAVSDHLDDINSEIEEGKPFVTESDLMLVICTPCYPPEFDPESFFGDYLPEDWSPEDSLKKETVAAMNEFIRCLKSEGPMSYNPSGKKRPAPLCGE